jgi:hypothetical protein
MGDGVQEKTGHWKKETVTIMNTAENDGTFVRRIGQINVVGRTFMDPITVHHKNSDSGIRHKENDNGLLVQLVRVPEMDLQNLLFRQFRLKGQVIHHNIHQGIHPEVGIQNIQ